MGLYTGDAQGLRLEKGWQCGGWLGRRYRKKIDGWGLSPEKEALVPWGCP